MKSPTALLLLLVLSTPLFAASPQTLRQQFIARMAERHGFDPQALARTLDRARRRQAILDAIARPAEKRLDWGQYRGIFLTRERIRGGLDYWSRNAAALARAEQEYGVPPEIIVAIIGVETRYGQHAGRYPVLDALTTLGFHYPPRARFFRSELEHFLLLAREEHIDPGAPLGSYAGAMGRPQFMPSSFRSYAVDFDHDGRRDIWKDDTDVIGSVANYFKRHGWRRGAPIAQRIHQLDPSRLGDVIEAGFKPSFRIAQLRARGLQAARALPDDALAAVLALKRGKDTQYWLVLHNFYVITRYNHSPLYAMAVYQLADAIARLHREQEAHKDAN
jgi:membrane-bound lytic murein transglycosylase B